jgi:endonuclease/exonuclease/phosphatase (EEP) superfamily protein YafD
MLAYVGVLFLLGAALAVIGGLLGAVSPLLDWLNHLAPAWAVGALIGTLLCLAAPRPKRPWLVGAGVVLTLAAAAPVLLEATTVTRPATRTVAPTLKVLTYNVYWYRPSEAAEALIAASGADVVALEEVDTHRDMLVRLRRLYPYQQLCRYCDLAILSKTPFLAVGRSPSGRRRRAVLWATVRAPDGRPATVGAVHLDWPYPSDGEAPREHLAMLAGRWSDDPILVGDFNLTPWSFTLRRLDERLQPLTRRTRSLPTYASHVPGAPPLLPIDHVYAAPAWRVVDLQRLPRTGSDHHPLLVELQRD